MSTSAHAIFDRLTAAAVGAGLPEGTLVFEDAVAGEGSAGTREACARVTGAAASSEVDANTCAPFLPGLARVLRDDAGLRFDFLQNLTAVDWIKRDVLEVVYHLFSYDHRHSFTLKIDLPRAAPRVPSVAGIWPAADWMEREQFDLLGVVFVGHPDLRRLLMPDDWAGHPMRKDYREPASYRGMPTTRPSPLELLKSHDRAHAPPPSPASSKAES